MTKVAREEDISDELLFDRPTSSGPTSLNRVSRLRYIFYVNFDKINFKTNYYWIRIIPVFIRKFDICFVIVLNLNNKNIRKNSFAVLKKYDSCLRCEVHIWWLFFCLHISCSLLLPTILLWFGNFIQALCL